MLILGAGGHAKEVVEIVLQMGMSTKEIVFIDDTQTIETTLYDFPVACDWKKIALIQNNFVLGVGGVFLRKKLSSIALEHGLSWKGLRSNSTSRGRFNVTIHENVDIMEHVIISNSVSINKGTLVNRNANIHHDCQIGSFCEIAPSVQIMGNVIIEDNTFIGAGSVILPGVTIGQGATIGAGSIVLNNVDEGSTIYGNPAKIGTK